MQKLDLQTFDSLSNNIELLQKLFPQVICEKEDENGNIVKAIDFDLFKQLFSSEIVEGSEERYNLNWPGKKASILKANTPINKTLRPVKEESVDFDNTQNLYIEGDNFEVLKVLQESYLGKVKMIYIDPPYNTGKDFVYKDNFKKSKDDYEDEIGLENEDGGKLFRNTDTNGRFHSDWLSMMYERLVVARDLLKDDGVIFMSIDDNEVHNLRKIADEIFGEENLITTFSWVNSISETIEDDTLFAGSNLGNFKKSFEYILLYSKNYGFKLLPDYPKEEYIIKLVTNGGNNINKIKVPKGIKCIKNITKIIKGKVGGDNDYYNILSDEGMIIQNGILINDVIIEGPLRNPNVLQSFFKNEEVIDRKGQKLIDVFLSESGMLHTKKERLGDTPSNVLVGKGTTKGGTLSVNNIFGNKVFDYSKPIELINYLISKSIGKKDKDIILDFFSGSGTTAHATMQLNAEDGGNRKFIMVQIPELTDETSEAYKAGYKNICEIGKERIRRAGKKILEDNKEKLAERETPLDTGFRVYKIDSSNMKDVYFHPNEIDQSKLFDLESNIKEDRRPLDLLTGVMLDLGLTLDLSIESKTIAGNTVYFVSGNSLVACFDEFVDFRVVDEIAKIEPLKVVFRDASFRTDSDKINFETRFKKLSPESVLRVI